MCISIEIPKLSVHLRERETNQEGDGVYTSQFRGTIDQWTRKLCGDEKRYGYLPLSFLLSSWPSLICFSTTTATTTSTTSHQYHHNRHQVMVSEHTRKIVTNQDRVRKTCGPIGFKSLLNCIISLEFSLNTPVGLLFLFQSHNNGRGKAITKFLQNNKNSLLTYLRIFYTIIL